MVIISVIVTYIINVYFICNIYIYNILYIKIFPEIYIILVLTALRQLCNMDQIRVYLVLSHIYSSSH